MTDRHLGEAAHQQQADDPADGIADEHARTGKADCKGAAEKQASAYGPADGNHRQLAGRQAVLQTPLAFNERIETLSQELPLVVCCRRIRRRGH
jgi:hypothetical protein